MDRAIVLGCAIDRLTIEQTIARSQSLIEARGCAQHVAVNAAKIVSMQSDPRLRQIVGRCALVNADGQSVVWASRLLGDPLPERVAGIDLMYRLLKLAEEKGYRVFVLGARQDVLERALERLRERHPRLRLAGARHGYFSEAESPAVCEEIRAARADILFVAMSSPRKEYWLAEHAGDLGTPFLMGVGGAIDVIAGVTRRAPRLVQRMGLEWLYRLVQEPRRLMRRYATTNFRFVGLTVRAFCSSKVWPRHRDRA